MYDINDIRGNIQSLPKENEYEKRYHYHARACYISCSCFQLWHSGNIRAGYCLGAGNIPAQVGWRKYSLFDRKPFRNVLFSVWMDRRRPCCAWSIPDIEETMKQAEKKPPTGLFLLWAGINRQNMIYYHWYPRKYLVPPRKENKYEQRYQNQSCAVPCRS